MSLFNKAKSLASQAVDAGKNAIADSDKIKKLAIEYLAGINYSPLISGLKKLEPVNPQLTLVISLAEKMQVIAGNYKNSEADDKDQILMQELSGLGKEFDLQTILEILEPVADNVPFGRLLLNIIKLIVSFSK